MRTTLNLDEELLATAMEMTGLTQKTEVLHCGLRALIQRAAANKLATMGGCDPRATAAPRRRQTVARHHADPRR